MSKRKLAERMRAAADEIERLQGPMKAVEGEPPRCEGWRRNGGAFTLGPVEWRQCENRAMALLTTADGVFPACRVCWAEAGALDIEILEAVEL